MAPTETTIEKGAHLRATRSHDHPHQTEEET